MTLGAEHADRRRGETRERRPTVQNGRVDLSGPASHPSGLSMRGRLLVATPPLGDPTFDRTVVFVLEHTDSGAVGVVLNRADVAAADLADEFDLDDLNAWEHLLAPPATIFVGGPVGEDSLIALAEGSGHREEAWGAVTGTVGTVDLSIAPDEVADRLSRVRIFRGYAGWAPGQLEGELRLGAWMVFDAIDDDLFTDRPSELWRTVVRRQGGRLRWIADAPDDLSLN
ncbi:MAG: YqgE/AlgH family protein [Acidimicrobiaceae bacterium]|nr:YqgE/AlgH family protein [Acidimicrobiaceae bacterium]